LYVFGQP
jgi:hypothetical protein